MEVYEALHKRHSVREYDSSKAIPDELIRKLLEAACEAPSAGNLQPWRFWVVRDGRIKKELAEAAGRQNFVYEAPVVIVVCADLSVSLRGYGRRGVDLYAIQDTAAAIENLLLAVCAEGLGACWVGAFNEDKVSESLSLESAIRPLAIIPIGYPLVERSKPSRRSIDKITKFV
ncbi:MAG: nitroreductase family protein [Actinobacteria bacterium]|nr:nitroreductase family protein [Actinomycetota bacterium]